MGISMVTHQHYFSFLLNVDLLLFLFWWFSGSLFKINPSSTATASSTTATTSAAANQKPFPAAAAAASTPLTAPASPLPTSGSAHAPPDWDSKDDADTSPSDSSAAQEHPYQSTLQGDSGDPCSRCVFFPGMCWRTLVADWQSHHISSRFTIRSVRMHRNNLAWLIIAFLQNVCLLLCDWMEILCHCQCEAHLEVVVKGSKYLLYMSRGKNVGSDEYSS